MATFANQSTIPNVGVNGLSNGMNNMNLGTQQAGGPVYVQQPVMMAAPVGVQQPNKKQQKKAQKAAQRAAPFSAPAPIQGSYPPGKIISTGRLPAGQQMMGQQTMGQQMMGQQMMGQQMVGQPQMVQTQMMQPQMVQPMVAAPGVVVPSSVPALSRRRGGRKQNQVNAANQAYYPSNNTTVLGAAPAVFPASTTLLPNTTAGLIPGTTTSIVPNQAGFVQQQPMMMGAQPVVMGTQPVVTQVVQSNMLPAPLNDGRRYASLTAGRRGRRARKGMVQPLTNNGLVPLPAGMPADGAAPNNRRNRRAARRANGTLPVTQPMYPAGIVNQGAGLAQPHLASVPLGQPKVSRSQRRAARNSGVASGAGLGYGGLGNAQPPVVLAQQPVMLAQQPVLMQQAQPVYVQQQQPIRL